MHYKHNQRIFTAHTNDYIHAQTNLYGKPHVHVQVMSFNAIMATAFPNMSDVTNVLDAQTALMREIVTWKSSIPR